MNRPARTQGTLLPRALAALGAGCLVVLASLPTAQASSGDSETTATPDCGEESILKTDGTTWSCTYADDFDGDGLDRAFWAPQVTGTSNYTTGTDDLYTCYEDDERVVAVRDGVLELSLLRLDAERDCGRGKNSRYIAGSVSHWGTHQQTYGRYEVRAKLPDVRTPGSQTTFWLWPVDQFTYGPWPLSGEIDFGEFYSVYPDHVIPFMHYWRGPVDLTQNRNVFTAYHCTIDYGAFNTYTLEWQPGEFTILVNGQLCLVNRYDALNAPEDRPYAPFDQPFFAALTQAMGTTGNEYDPAVMPERITTQVDYIRIWE